MENLVLVTTLNVVKTAKNVKINKEKIKVLAQKMVKNLVLPNWTQNVPFKTENPEMMLNYLITLDSLNFCFWSKKEKWRIVYKNKEYDGYFALAISLNIFFKNNPKKANLEYFKNISFDELSKIFAGRGELQFLKKRWQIIRAVSSTLLRKYKNSSEFIVSANKKLANLVKKISEELPSFNDSAYYRGRKVYFLKRAQILAGDIYTTFGGRGVGCFTDPDCLTAFADYKLPQILNYFGILEYSAGLKKKIEKKIIIPTGSKQEIEIRSSTIWAVEYLRRCLNNLGKDINSSQIDWILWSKSQKINFKMPYHLTKTIFY